MRTCKHDIRGSSDSPVIKRLKSVNSQLNKNFGVSKIGIFGSYSRGEEKKGSDIDVLVEFNKPVNLFEFSRLKSFISNHLGVEVDLVTPGALKPLIKEKILKNIIYIDHL
jgi:predicted nucleotidyltransferase